jgi:hypothetical protein
MPVTVTRRTPAQVLVPALTMGHNERRECSRGMARATGYCGNG